ncbi:hypothetical protein Q7499_09850 [Glaesserella parasuis]|nr:hypothetical protein [Glaesserella parasuis]MDO9834452.1 hypothetical protein [Glaesserella parasuis]
MIKILQILVVSVPLVLGSTDTQSNRSDNKSSSWSVGVFVGKSGGAQQV